MHKWHEFSLVQGQSIPREMFQTLGMPEKMLLAELTRVVMSGGCCSQRGSSAAFPHAPNLGPQVLVLLRWYRRSQT